MNLRYYFGRSLIALSEFVFDMYMAFDSIVNKVAVVAEMREAEYAEWEKSLNEEYPSRAPEVK